MFEVHSFGINFCLAVLLWATRGSRGPSESLQRAAWELGLTETVHQAPINAPVQSQMEQTNSALPLTIQITPLGTHLALRPCDSYK